MGALVVITYSMQNVVCTLILGLVPNISPLNIENLFGASGFFFTLP